MKNLTKICCLLLNLSFCAYAEEAQVIDLKNESQVVNPQVNEASSQTSPYQNLIKDYTYKVPFLGDLDAAYQDTFNLLVKDLSNGAMSGNDLSVDISSLILSENIGDDFIEITYGANSVCDLLNSGKITIWKGIKEPVVLWMVVSPDVYRYLAMQNSSNDASLPQNNVEVNTETASNAKIISANDSIDLFSQSFIAKGKSLNVHIIYPMQDLDDMMNLKLDEVMRGDTNKVTNASKRYSNGYAIASMLFCNDDKLRMIYHIVDLKTGKELAKDSIDGDYLAIVNEFYERLKSATNVTQVVQNQTLLPPTTSIDVSSFNLGPVNDTNYRILIRNIANFSDVVKIKNIFLSLGFLRSDIVDINGDNVVFNLGHAKGANVTDVLSKLGFIKLMSPNEYYLAMDVSSFNANDVTEEPQVDNNNLPQNNEKAQNPNQNIENNHVNDNMQYKPKNENSINSKYPDPNKKLHTGGGLKE